MTLALKNNTSQQYVRTHLLYFLLKSPINAILLRWEILESRTATTCILHKKGDRKVSSIPQRSTWSAPVKTVSLRLGIVESKGSTLLYEHIWLKSTSRRNVWVRLCLSEVYGGLLGFVRSTREDLTGHPKLLKRWRWKGAPQWYEASVKEKAETSMSHYEFRLAILNFWVEAHVRMLRSR